MGRTQPKPTSKATVIEAESGIKRVNMIKMKCMTGQRRTMGESPSMKLSNRISTLKEKLRLWKDSEKSMGESSYDLFGLRAPPGKVCSVLLPKRRARKGRLIERSFPQETDSTATPLLHQKRPLEEEFEQARAAWERSRKLRRIESDTPQPLPPPTVTAHTSVVPWDTKPRQKSDVDSGATQKETPGQGGETMEFQLEQLKDFITLVYNKSKANAASKSKMKRAKRVKQTSTCKSSDVAALTALFDSTLSLRLTTMTQQQLSKQETCVPKASNPIILPQSPQIIPSTPGILFEPVQPELQSDPLPSATFTLGSIGVTPSRNCDMNTIRSRQADLFQPDEDSMGKDEEPSKPQFSIIVALTARFKTALSLGTKIKTKAQNPFECCKKANYLRKFLFTSHCIRDECNTKPISSYGTGVQALSQSINGDTQLLSSNVDARFIQKQANYVYNLLSQTSSVAV